MQSSEDSKRATSDPVEFSPAPLRSTSDVSLDIPDAARGPNRPPNARHLSSPTYDSPLRHHRRQVSTPRQVKETLHARSEYTNSEDDGAAIHRINQYVIKQEIGRGSFGAVHLAIDQHDTEYAVKEFSKSRLRKRAQSHVLRRPYGSGAPPGHFAAGGRLNSPLHRREASDIHKDEKANPLFLIREEIAIMKKLNHHNLVQLLEVLDDPTEDSLYMVLEMCKKGVVMKIGMGERADPYDTESCRCWFRDLILGIEYLHAQGIVHRDIKPDNLLLTHDDILKIVDFGVSEMFEKESDMTTAKSAGSPAFLPPELCISKHGKISGKAADIWSMGVTLYCLFYGRVPFERTSVLELYECIKNDPVEFDGNCDTDFKDLMHRLLEKNPDERIKMPELREHPWVTKNGVDPLLSFEENTANLAEPPTEEEMNHAITGNLSNLIVVMRAVNKFRALLTRKRPVVMDSILGQSIVQPPLQLEKTAAGVERVIGRVISPSLNHLQRSDGTYNKHPIKQAFASEPFQRDLESNNQEAAQPSLMEGTISPNNTIYSQHNPLRVPLHVKEPKRVDSGNAMDDHIDHGKGHAHDPLDDFLYLSIGPGADNGPENHEALTVSESPPAAEIDIYETAYHDEVQRIRSNSRSATLYLTRRVEKPEIFEKVAGLVGAQSAGRSALTGLIDKAKERGHQVFDKATLQTGEVSNELQQKVSNELQQRIPFTGS